MKLCYHYILATLLALTLAACSDEETDMRLNAESTEVYVSVMLNVSGNTAEMTRAGYIAPGDGTPDIDMQDGLDYENAINDKDVELYVFDQEGTFVEKVLITWHTSGTWYGVLNTISQEDVTNGKHFHIVALCNQKGALNTNYSTPTAGTTTLDDFIASLSFSGYTEEFTKNLTMKDHQGADVSPSSTTYIPMWGIKSIQFAGQGLCTNVGEINVLRAMAKVRVAIGVQVQTDGFTLNGCTLNVANKKGYLAAQKNGDTPQAYVATTDNNGIKTYTTAWNTDESVNPTNATPITIPSICQESPIATTSTPLPFSKVTEEGNSCYVIYIPEYNHVKDDEETPQSPATITLSITQGEYEVKDQNGNNYSLHFADYSDGKSPTAPEWDIIRNDIYDYTITRIESGRLEANVRVMPWEYETMEYELSQNAAVVLTSEASAVFNTTLSRWSNEVLYSADDASSGYATFTFKVKEPAGVRWVAHLTDPYNFTFTTGSKTYGFGGTDDEYTITVKPRGKFSKVLETDLYFTIETLLDTEADITPVDANGNYVTGDYGIANRRIHIAQVETRTGDTGDEVPFRVDMSAWGAAVSSGSTLIAKAKTGIYSYSGLTYPTDIETKTIYKAYPTDIETQTIYTGADDAKCNNGVVMAAYNGTLYCMWQTSATKEDTPDTHIHYSISTDGGETWSAPQDLTDPNASSEGYTSSGGWLVADDRLIAYVNTWLGGTKTSDTEWEPKPAYGKTRYIDMSNSSAISEVTMEGGSELTAIFEQDPHVITLPNGTKRIINAGHFQTATIQGTEYNNGLYVNPIYTDYSTDGISGWKKATFSASAKNSAQEQSREMEPSIFQKANGDLVMIFRDNEAQNAAERRVRASVSHDYGLTWSDPVATNLYDSKSKQCAGNLPDGTAFIVNNPVQSETRSPLVIHLSKDGETFSQSYLLRTGYTEDDDATGGIQDREGSAGSGYCYPKAMGHGDYLYVSYSTNKEDVEYTRILLSSIQLNDPSAR